MKLRRESNLEEVFLFIENVEENPTGVILFVDKSALCNTYTTQTWLQQEDVQIVEVDGEMVDVLQIGKVPQFRFFVNGTEVHELIGTVSYETFQERKKNLFGASLLKLKNYKSSPPAAKLEVEL